MIAFEDGSGGVRGSYSSFVPARVGEEIDVGIMCYDAMPKLSASADSHSKFAIRLFIVRRTKNERVAQELIVIARSQRVRPSWAGPMTGSATKQSISQQAEAWIASLRSQ
jgi:hypothetical protein